MEFASQCAFAFLTGIGFAAIPVVIWYFVRKAKVSLPTFEQQIRNRLLARTLTKVPRRSCIRRMDNRTKY